MSGDSGVAEARRRPVSDDKATATDAPAVSIGGCGRRESEAIKTQDMLSRWPCRSPDSHSTCKRAAGGMNRTLGRRAVLRRQRPLDNVVARREGDSPGPHPRRAIRCSRYWYAQPHDGDRRREQRPDLSRAAGSQTSSCPGASCAPLGATCGGETRGRVAANMHGVSARGSTKGEVRFSSAESRFADRTTRVNTPSGADHDDAPEAETTRSGSKDGARVESVSSNATTRYKAR